MNRHVAAQIAGIALAAGMNSAYAQTAVGTVSVCYYSAECSFANIPGLYHAPDEAQRLRDSGEHQGVPMVRSSTTYPPVDAPAFQFTNTGTAAITSASFSIAANASLGIVKDIFHIGTIAPGASFVIVPGASNDKKVHPSGGFFTYSAPGNPLDTSDSGPNANAIVFKFSGKIGSQAVSSGNFKPGNSKSPSVDGTVASLNFLGGPGNADGPCNDCYATKVVAKITETAVSAVEP
jgi:hypothetical protein